MQALGNDFIVVDGRHMAAEPAGLALLRAWTEAAPKLAATLCDRHLGVGADGLILVLDRDLMAAHGKLLAPFLHNSHADIGWIYTNGDGSPSSMCGNGLRCLALLSVNHKIVQKNEFTVATGAGLIRVRYEGKERIAVDIGVPRLNTKEVPMSGIKMPQFVAQTLTVQVDGAEHKYVATCVSMGNPHCIIFGDYKDVPCADKKLGREAVAIQTSSFFPEGVNVEFATVLSPKRIKVLVWERGCGPTFACASGAAAALVAGVLENKVERICTISLPGGDLVASWEKADSGVVLTGSAEEVFQGQIDLLKFQSLRGLLAAEAICSQ